MQLERVVVAVDFSAASLAAARWVTMQLAPRAEVVLAHVVSEPPAPSFVRPWLRPLSAIVEELTPALHGALRGLAGAVGSTTTRVKLLYGVPADALASLGREIGADLICLGRRQRRRGGARFGHTTAQRLLEQTRIPVLVVPGARPTLPARILAPIDDQPGSSSDLAAAGSLAQAYEAALDVLHVLSPELPRLVSFGRADTPEALAMEATNNRSHLEALTHEWLASQMQRVSASARRVTSHVRFGDPGEQIVEFVRAAGVDLLTMGRGVDETIANITTSGGEAYTVGSTSRLVLWASPCPVLVLPPTLRAAKPESPLRSDRRHFQLPSRASTSRDDPPSAA